MKLADMESFLRVCMWNQGPSVDSHHAKERSQSSPVASWEEGKCIALSRGLAIR